MRVWTVLIFVLCASVEAAFRTEPVSGGFSAPVFVTAPPGDTSRLFIVEQISGRIRIYDRDSGTILGTDFLDVTGLLAGGEQGLLGLAFHPQYSINGFFYVNFTAPGGGGAGHTEIARYRVAGSPANSNVADPASKKLIISYDQPESNHNGGWLGFGLDGYLYIAAGDGGGGNDQHGTIGNGQSRTTLLGKILRLDVDNGDPYAIPDGNPYKGDPAFLNEIWAFGLRNPFRCSIDRQTGDLWIGDVGQNTREEIDFDPAGSGGLNFGWRPREGTIATPGISETPVTTATGPVFDYGRTVGTTVIGGFVYRGSKIPELEGKYVFGDYGSLTFWVMTHNGSTFTAQDQTSVFNPSNAIQSLTSFGEDGVGELYICDYTAGAIFAIVPGHPVAADDSLVRARNSAGKINVSQLLANDSDALGHSLTVASVTSPSVQGATISLDGDWVVYDPPSGFNGADSFSYTVSDGTGFTATGNVSVTVSPDGGGQTLNIISATHSGSDVIVICAGIPGRTYEIQTTSDLTSPITWTPHPAGQKAAGANGSFQLTDSAPPSPRYYRAIQIIP
jgi:glucose/arabinose dehydrogenase